MSLSPQGPRELEHPSCEPIGDCSSTRMREGHAMAPSNALRALAAMLLAAALSAALVGCAPTPEEAIRSSLSEELDAIKSLDEGFLGELEVGMDVGRFSEYGIDGMEFMKAYLDGFDYSIDSVEVDEATAAATVTITCKSFSQYRERLAAAAQELIDGGALSTMGNDEINAAYGKLITERLEGIEAAPTESFAVTYELDGDAWEPTTALDRQISSAILTN